MYKYTDIEHEFEMMNEFIETEMYKVREETVGKLSSYLVHPNLSIRSLLLTISYAYFDSNQHAEIVSQQLNLGKLEFLSIAEDFEAFKEEYLKNYEEAQNF